MIFKFTSQVRGKIPELVRQGLNGRQIARIVGVRYSSLKVLCSMHGISLDHRPYARSVKIELAPETYRALQDKAKQLRMSRSDLAERVLEVVVNDNLFKALELT